ncbi:hypothetical protein SAMN05216480_1129 [Pustulibacterium marinum]|uniref:DUF493 domain-containing protein n=1 Tax=Pustulibacterium marinum TaxID=1224947 RepID=A0A1I7HZS2_9FLAO|nr:DUF493 family protein [Pustulibacterium marinum]SFU66195.1 hypothetical protein SAMN05216480_1129 [Pustulibacterium marinum]
MSTEKEAAFYDRLREELNNTSLWPSEYLYKFIVPTSEEKIQQIESIFDNKGAVITTKQSSGGKFSSISINLKLKNPDEVIFFYKEVGKIEGVISL